MSHGSLAFALGGLLLLSAFFSSAETAMLALDRYRLKVLVHKGHRGAQRAARLLRRKDRLLGLILLGNNLVNISASAITTLLALNLFGETGVVIATIALTLIIIIFAEIGPKTAAALHPAAFAYPASLVLLPLSYLLWPAVWVLNTLSNFMLGLFGVDPQRHRDSEGTLGREELRILLLDPDNESCRRYTASCCSTCSTWSIPRWITSWHRAARCAASTWTPTARPSNAIWPRVAWQKCRCTASGPRISSACSTCAMCPNCSMGRGAHGGCGRP